MSVSRDLVLDIWREGCRHIDFQESVDVIAAKLAKHLPIQRLVVRKFTEEPPCLNTVVRWQAENDESIGAAKTQLTPQQVRKIKHWGKRAKSTLIAGELVEDFQFAVPWEPESSLLIGPLYNADGLHGLLILAARSGSVFLQQHESIVVEMLEPFSVALENHRRLHELASLREAAEAERQSLLTRLGTQEVNEAIVGAETGLRFVMERVQLVAASDAPVLILGETGTGKEVVSRAIHTRSKRASGPFIRVNCGAIPSELIDSQLFGHEKGSFTGASESRQGWFERADGGTLFLDEIGELPLEAQVRLLRVLQDGFIERVGGQHPIRVDVRIIAATHRDLASMAKTGGFREDLWYRINVFPILLPKLRERREDISALARHFARRAAVKFGLAPVEPKPSDLQLLLAYDWPGNIRELGAVIDRAVILGRGKSLETAQALGQDVQEAPPKYEEATFYEVIPEAPTFRPRPAPLNRSDDMETLDEAIKRHIEKALIATQGQIEGTRGAAALLDINPHTLRAKMRKLGLDWSKFRPT